MEIKEFNIPVPWGHVAAKAWGNEADTPVIAIHGIGDNAESFDRLLPFLPTSFYYICIDLPSHGKSSHYPPHLLISALNNIHTCKIVVDYLSRKKYIFMGHSWGGQTAVLFAQLYPEHVLKLIALDVFYFHPITVRNFKDHWTGKFDTLMRIHGNQASYKQPTFTYEEAVQKLIDGRVLGELHRESAEALVQRSLIPVENGKFQFSTDPRLKVFVNGIYDFGFIEKIVKKYPVTCPVLFIHVSENERQLSYFKGFVDELKRQNKTCQVRKVTGSLDIHINNPEIVGPIISKFIISAESKL